MTIKRCENCLEFTNGFRPCSCFSSSPRDEAVVPGKAESSIWSRMEANSAAVAAMPKWVKSSPVNRRD